MSVQNQLEQIFLLEEIGEQPVLLDSSVLVREVKKYPIIYDNTLRRDQIALFNAWETICHKMLPNYHLMNADEKIASRKRLRDRWGYMRSTFRRDIFNNRIDSRKHLQWVWEIQFLVPILARNISKTCRRSIPYKKKSPTMASSSPIDQLSSLPNVCFQQSDFADITAVEYCQSEPAATTANPQSESSNEDCIIINEPEPETENAFQIQAINEVVIPNDVKLSNNSVNSTPTHSSDTSLSINSSFASSTSVSPARTETPDNTDLMVDTFLATFSLDSFHSTNVDPDKMFLLAMLHNYRLVRNEFKESLQHKFYTFLRD